MKNIERKIIYIWMLATILLLIQILTTNTYDVNKDGIVNSKDLLDLRNYLINKGDDK